MSSVKRQFDFQALYEDSLQLTNHIDSYGIPTLQRGLDQLGESSRRMAEGGHGDEDVVFRDVQSRDSTLKANFLLAGRGFDAEKLSRDLKAIELKASYEPLEPLGDTDIEGFLRHHHEMIVVTAIDEAKACTRLEYQRVASKYLDDEWEQAKYRILESLGQRKGVWGGGDPNTTFTSSQNTSAANKSFLSASSSNILGEGALVSRSKGPLVPAEQRPTKTMMTPLMMQYSNVVRALLDQRRVDGRSSVDVVTNFIKVADAQVSPGTADSRSRETLKLWKTVQAILSGASSDRILVEQQLEDDYREQSHALQQRLVRGAIQSLESEYDHHIQMKVKAANARVGGVPGLIPSIQAWMAVRFDIQRLPAYLQTSQFVDGLPLWPQVYYSLRCGGNAEAASILKSARSKGVSGIDDSIIVALELIAESESGSKPEGLTSESWQQIHQALSSAYLQLSSSRSGTGVDPFKKTVLNILARADPAFSHPEVATTVEDFMWQKLQFAKLQGGRHSEKSAFTVTQLSELIRRFGPAHFDKDRRTPLVYFKVLVLAQEFERAVDYLASSGYVMEAVHFAVALYWYGLLLTPDYKQTKAYLSHWNSTHVFALEDLASGLLLQGPHGAGRPFLDVPRLLKQYGHMFARSNPKEAVDYLMMIRDEALRHNALKELLLDTREFALLVGFMTPDGTRNPGFLDSRISRESIQRLIEDAGREAEFNGRAQDALDLYLCAGEIVEVVTIFITQLSQALCPPHPARDHWKTLAFTFTDQYLSKPFARQKLNENFSLGNTFQLLLNLIIFFDQYSDNNNAAAIDTVDKLQLLPTSDDPSTLNAKEEVFESLDTRIKAAFHQVLVGYMTCLFKVFEALKKERVSRTDER